MMQASGRAPSTPAFDFLSIAPENIRVFHYSKGIRPEVPGEEPPVGSILVCNPATGDRRRFSRCREARALDITPGEAGDHRLLEKRTLERFFAYLAECGDICWVIWTIRSDFGLDHLAQRLRELGGEPPARLPRQFSLREHFKQCYGDDFAPDKPHGQLQSLAAMNNSSLADWLSQEEAATAFSQGNDTALDRSLEQKVGWVLRFLRRHRRGELVTGQSDPPCGHLDSGKAGLAPTPPAHGVDGIDPTPFIVEVSKGLTSPEPPSNAVQASPPVEKLRAAFREDPSLAQASPKRVRKVVAISEKACRDALYLLWESGEYQGYGRRPPPRIDRR